MTAHMIIALEHSSGCTCTEAMGLNPVEVPNVFFCVLICNCLS